MKDKTVHKILYAVTVLCLIGFAVRLGADWFLYDAAENSAPFSVFVLARAVEFIVPAIAAFAVGTAFRKK